MLTYPMDGPDEAATSARHLTGLRFPLASLIVLAVALVYAQALGHGFIGLDDPQYVTKNPHVAGGLTLDGVRWAFTTTYYANWHPLTWLSHLADVELYGLQPAGHHLTNVMLHATSALLLFAALARMTKAPLRSAFVAILFAVHPLNVEPVAWVAERKGVLSTTFWMLCIYAYARYVERPGRVRYILVVLPLALGLLAKQMLVTLPLALVLLDYWPLGRIGRGERSGRLPAGLASCVMEKTPLFMLAAFFAVIAYLGQRGGGGLTFFPDAVLFQIRAANALVSYGTYAWKMLWPTGLGVYYPLQGFPGWGPVAIAGAFVLPALLIAVAWAGKFPYLTVGYFWYLGTALPVIQLVQVGGHSHADRYAYIPLVGLFVAFTWLGADLAKRGATVSRILPALAAGVVIVLGFAAHKQAGYWRDSRTLFAHTIAVTDLNSTAEEHYGQALMDDDDYEEAIAHFEKALAWSPGARSLTVHNNIGVSLMMLGREREALPHFIMSLEVSPGEETPEHLVPLYAGLRANLGVAFERLGANYEAYAMFKDALRIDPRCEQAIRGLKRLASRTSGPGQ